MKKLFVVLVLFSCSGEKPTIEGFKEQIWIEDKMGCNDLRADLYNVLLENKDVLTGLSEDELIDFMGKPDQTELYSRNQKFYYYYIEPGTQCGEAFENDDPAKVIFRFNATGLVNEITLYN